MMTITYNNLDYDGNFDHKEATKSICSYAEGLEGGEMKVVSRRVFEPGFTPAQVTVNGRKGRRVGCVLAEDSVAYMVFDLDQEEDEEEEEDGDEDKEEGEDESEESMAVDNDSDYE
jgi:anaphase-promoting complex subunit 4